MTAQRRARRINGIGSSIGVWLLSAVLLVWTLLPIYNIIRVSMQEKEEVLSTSVIPVAPSPHGVLPLRYRQATSPAASWTAGVVPVNERAVTRCVSLAASCV